jgi:hypothetical protein
MLGLGKFVYLDDEVDPREERITQMLSEAHAPEAEMAMVIKDLDAFRQANPLSLPQGFYLAVTPPTPSHSKGRRLGFGFYCKKCGIHIPGRAPAEVKHCGKISALPRIIAESHNQNGYRKTIPKDEFVKKFSIGDHLRAKEFWWKLRTVVVHPS